MFVEKTKQELQAQIDEARKRYFAGNRKMARLRPEAVKKESSVKPRQQRLGLFA